MERDPNISRLIRDSGLAKAPSNFTGQVMNRIGIETEKSIYKPLIGKTGRILILLFIAGVVAVSLFYSEPGGWLMEFTSRLSNVDWKLPQFHFNLDFISEINISTWLVSTLVALFLLLLSDFRLRRKKRMV